MNAKTEAQELYGEYYVICQEFTEEIQCSIQAKKCALAALEFTIIFIDNEGYRYLEEVKQEIEKL